MLLDRDGVINFDSPDYILAPDQWQPVPGALAAIARLHAAGIAVAIVSNQSALARGMIDQECFNAIHGKMMLAIEQAGGFISHVAYCPHGPDDHCACRKPKPGMVTDTLAALGLDGRAEAALFIGDSLRDVQAAHAAGVRAMLVRSGYGDAGAIHARAEAIQPGIESHADLAEAVASLFGGEG